jgi:hypothetical protein
VLSACRVKGGLIGEAQAIGDSSHLNKLEAVGDNDSRLIDLGDFEDTVFSKAMFDRSSARFALIIAMRAFSVLISLFNSLNLPIH